MYGSIPNIRQSKDWESYMANLGWKCFRTDSGSCLNIMRIPVLFMSVAKIQKPYDLDEKDFQSIEEICRKQKVAFLKIEPNENQNQEIFKDYKYESNNMPLSPSTTSYIDLTKSESELWDKLSRSGKYGVKRSKREGATIKCFQNPEDGILKEFYEIHHKTAKRKKFFTRGFKDLCKRRDAFKENSHLVMVYDKDNNLCGGKFFIANSDMVLFTYGGISDFGRKNKTGFSLMWESMLYLKGKGYKVLDLEGMYDPRYPKQYEGWEGFTEFKKKFGPEVVVFPAPYERYFNPVLKFMSKHLGMGL